MAYDKHYSRQTARHDMNLALDGELPDASKASLGAHLENSAADTALWSNMRTVDQLFSAEPMVQAPVDFAARVKSTIAAEKQAASARQRTDLRTAVGLLLTVVLLLPLVVSTLIFVQRWLSDPAALSSLLHQIMLLINTIAQAITSIFPVIAQDAAGGLLLTLLATGAIAALMVQWMTSRREIVVYRIPVIAG